MWNDLAEAIAAQAMHAATRTVTTSRIERRLAAILAADVAGYSQLMGTPRPVAYSPQDRRLSVIVLPFESSSGDPAQDGVAAGITRDVTDIISGDSTVPLVAAATAAAYRGKTFDLRAIGHEHDVHFALTGNARRQDGQRLIVVATLYEAR